MHRDVIVDGARREPRIIERGAKSVTGDIDAQRLGGFQRPDAAEQVALAFEGDERRAVFCEFMRKRCNVGDDPPAGAERVRDRVECDPRELPKGVVVHEYTSDA
jgi:hypothetical protein